MSTGGMIDISAKDITAREAVAVGSIRLLPATVRQVQDSSLPKGNALETARVAAVMAAKRTPDIIPLCHPLLLTKVGCEFACSVDEGTITATVTVRCQGQTGVEMEALAGVAAALLTIYDMTKGVDDTLEIHSIYLREKRGGRSGEYLRATRPEEEL